MLRFLVFGAFGVFLVPGSLRARPVGFFQAQRSYNPLRWTLSCPLRYLNPIPSIPESSGVPLRGLRRRNIPCPAALINALFSALSFYLRSSLYISRPMGLRFAHAPLFPNNPTHHSRAKLYQIFCSCFVNFFKYLVNVLSSRRFLKTF